MYNISIIIHTDPDVVDGGWTDWSDWSDCTEACGGGEQEQTRTCTNPPPAGAGATCDGLDKQTQPCNTDECEGKQYSPSCISQYKSFRLCIIILLI